LRIGLKESCAPAEFSWTGAFTSRIKDFLLACPSRKARRQSRPQLGIDMVIVGKCIAG
jgi:hypothetical protein